MIVSDATWLPFHFPDPQDAWEVHFWRRQAEGSPKLRVRLSGWNTFVAVVAFSKLCQTVQTQFSGGLDFKSNIARRNIFLLHHRVFSRKPAESCLDERVWEDRGAFLEAPNATFIYIIYI